MGRILVGVFLLLMGLGFFADQFNFGWFGLSFGSVMSLFWVVVGIMLYTRRHIFWGTVFTVLGFLGFLGGFFPGIPFGALFLPVIFVAIGLSILFRSPEKMIEGRIVTGSADADEIRETVAFGSLERSYTSRNFKGGKIDVAFGGFKLDLRNIKVAKEGAVLEINAAFGGGEIFVPQDAHVISEGSGVMGGWANRFNTVGDTKDATLVIRGSAIFGGVEIKN